MRAAIAPGPHLLMVPPLIQMSVRFRRDVGATSAFFADTYAVKHARCPCVRTSTEMLMNAGADISR